MTEVIAQAFAPRATTFESQRGIERVGTLIDPSSERLAARPLKGGLQLFAILERNHVPAHRLEQAFDGPEQAVRDRVVEALPVVVDHPPDITYVVFPTLQQCFEDIAFVQLRIPDYRDHAAV